MRGLLEVAQGGLPASAKYIVDVDITTLPALPPTHRDYHRREECRTKTITQNRANAERRFILTMQAWTSLYATLKACTEKTAPVLYMHVVMLYSQ